MPVDTDVPPHLLFNDSVTAVKLGRRLLYRKARIVPEDSAQGLTLAHHVRTAIAPLRDPIDRKMVYGSEGEEETTYVWNDSFIAGDIVVGELLKYQSRSSQAVVSKDAVKNRLMVRQIDPPDDGEYMRGILLFLIRGDDVVFMTTNTFRDSEAVRYLNWLLRDKTTQLNGGSVAMLQATFSEFIQNREGIRGLKEITLSAPASSLLADAAMIEPQNSTLNYKPAEKLRALTRTLLDDGAIPGLSLADAIDARPLDVEVTVKLSGNARSNSALLDALMLGTRLLGGVSCDLVLRNGTRIRGENVTISVTKAILHRQGYPDFADARVTMRAWLGDVIGGGLDDTNKRSVSRA